MMHTHFPRTITDLEPGDHLCCLYETEEEHRAVLAPFLHQGLERGEKVIYIVDARTADGYLQEDELDVEPYLVNGQLSILTRDDTYMRGGVFDPERMVALLRAETEQALAEGYPALRVTGEMTWVLQGLPGSERLIEYEARLNEFFPDSKCLALCQYDRRRFDPVMLLDVLRTHPIAIVGTEIYDNFYYIPPAEFLSRNIPAAELRRWVQNLAELRGEALKASEELYCEGSPSDVSERKQRERELEAIASMSAALRTASTRADMLPAVLDQALDLLSAEGAALAMRDPTSGETVIELAHGDWIYWAGERLPPSKGVSGRVIATGQPYMDNDMQADSLFGRPDMRGYLRAVACVPLIAQEQAIGALWVGRKTDITKEEIHLLTTIGDIAANAIYRASLHEQIAWLFGQLENRNRFFARILDTIPTSLLVIDRGLRVVSANRNFLRKSRREEQDTLGRKIEEVFPQVLLEYTQLSQKVRSVFSTGEPIAGGKLSYRAPGLSTRIYYYRLIPLKLVPDGERGAMEETVENVMLLMDDVTEREQLEEEVRRTERHLASVVDSASDLVVSMDPEGRILTWNRAAEGTSEFESEEVKGRRLPALCVEEDRQKMGSWLRQWAKGRFTDKSVEINLKTKEGGEVSISWTGSRMLDDEHRIVALVAVGRDLTERKRLEAQLIQSAKLSSLGVMAGGIAHEIRNPLAISSAAAQLLLERPEDKELREGAVKRIYSGIQRASYIIENLLKFARPPEERMLAVDINELLKETSSLLANQFKVHRVKLQKGFASDLPPVIGNKSLLQQVFSNMILNACNAMPDGGNLTIATRVNSGNQVEIEFADTGYGIPKENLSKIFDPFFTTMPAGEGVGLGLSISYSIIQRHQGTIEAESQAGQGSTFTVRLPVTSDN